MDHEIKQLCDFCLKSERFFVHVYCHIHTSSMYAYIQLLLMLLCRLRDLKCVLSTSLSRLPPVRQDDRRRQDKGEIWGRPKPRQRATPSALYLVLQKLALWFALSIIHEMMVRAQYNSKLFVIHNCYKSGFLCCQFLSPELVIFPGYLLAESTVLIV